MMALHAGWRGLLTFLAVLCAGALLLGACGGGSDTSQIKARLTTFTNDFNNANGKGLLNDIAPNDRKGCTQQQVQQQLDAVKSLSKIAGGNIKLAVSDVKVKSIKGNNADVGANVALQGLPSTSNTPSNTTFKMSKSGGNWYLATEGQACQSLFAPTPSR